MTTERRRFRYAVKPRPFVMMTGSGGILRDVSDEGLAIDVVGPNLTTKRIHFNFAISETGDRFEGLGEVIWKNESGSRIGVRFVDLSDTSRQRFQNWLSTKSDSAVSFKNGNRQNCGEAGNSATHLWMRPRTDASRASDVLNLQEETKSALPAFSHGPSMGSAMKPATQYTNITPPGLYNSTRPGRLTESQATSPLSASSIAKVEKQFEVPSPHFSNFATANLETSEWPGTENSASSSVLESDEKVIPSVLPASSALTPEKEFKSISSPHLTSVPIPNVKLSEWQGTGNSATSAALESAEQVMPSVLPADGAFISEKEFKSVSHPHFTSAAIPTVEISERPSTESSTTSTPDRSEGPIPPLLLETEFASVPSREDGTVTASNFDTQAWLRPRIQASAATEHVKKMEPGANVASHSSESLAFGSLASVVAPNEVEEPVQTDVRSSFKKILMAKSNLDPEIDPMAGARNWQGLFRWILAGAMVCLGILAVGLGIRLSEDQVAASMTYQTVKAFLLDTFIPSNTAPVVVHNVSTNVSAHPLHLSKELKTSRVHVTDSPPANKPMGRTKYEVLDAKTGRRYFPHTGTSIAVNFVRAQTQASASGPGSPASAAKVLSGSEADLGGGKIGKVSQKSSGELPVKEVIPEYPTLALQKNVQGRVALSAIITTDGSLRDVRVVGSPSILDNAALSAVKEWRYQGHYDNGRPVEVETQIFVDFSISMEK